MMHIHNVYFWLKSGLDDEAKTSFEDGLNSLCNDPNAESGHFGKPADTHRDVVENSYNYSLVLFFEDLPAHDRYQTSPVHNIFIDAHLSKWERVVVYDIEV
jgi:hypothetical protein